MIASNADIAAENVTAGLFTAWSSKMDTQKRDRISDALRNGARLALVCPKSLDSVTNKVMVGEELFPQGEQERQSVRSCRSETSYVQNLESRILGSVILNNALWPQVAELDESVFSSESNRRILRTMRSLMAHGGVIDLLLLQGELGDKVALSHLISLTDTQVVLSLDTIPSFIDRLRQGAAKRRVIGGLERQLSRCDQVSLETLIETLKAIAEDGETTFKAGSGKNKLVTICMDDVEMELVNWAWRDVLPFGALSGFFGDPGLGKGLCTIAGTACLTTGRDWPDGQNNPHPPCDVLMIGAEDSDAQTVKPRLVAAGADVKRVHTLRYHVDGHGEQQLFQLSQNLSHLRCWLEDHPAVKWIFIDPISSFLGEKVNMNSETDIRRTLTPLTDVLEQHQIGCTIVGHLNKGTDKAAIYRAGGAMGLVGVPRIAWAFGRLKEKNDQGQDQCVMSRLKGNIARDIGSLNYVLEGKDVEVRPGVFENIGVFVPKGRGETTADDVMTHEIDTTAGIRSKEACEWLGKYLAKMGSGAKVACSEIVTESAKVGITRSTLDRAARELRINREREATTKMSYWSLP